MKAPQEPASLASGRPGLASNATWRVLGTAFRVLAGLVSVPLYTGFLGMSHWGLLSLFMALSAPLAMLDLGLGTATVKYVAEALGKGDRQGAVRVVHTTLLFNVAMGLFGGLAVVLASRWLATSLFDISPTDVERAVLGFRLTAVSGIVSVLTATYAAVLAGHQRYDVVTRLLTLGVATGIGSGLAAAAAGGDAVHVLAAQIGAAALVVIAWFRAAEAVLPGVGAIPRWHSGTFRRSFAYGAWEAVWVGGGMLAANAGRYVLGAFFAPAVVGFFAIVHLLSSQLVAAFADMGEVLFPAVSRMQGEGRLVEARRLALLVGWTLTTVFGIAATVLAIAGGSFLHLWISAEAAREATGTLRLLCVAGVLGMAMTAPISYVAGVGGTRWGAAVNGVLALTVVGLSLLLVPRHGLAGAGYGLLAGFATEWLFLALIWRGHFATDFRFGHYAAHVFAPPLVSIAVLASSCWARDAISFTPTWPRLVVEVAVSLLVVAAAQVAAGELLPGGAARRRDVVNSFRPIVLRRFGTAGR